MILLYGFAVDAPSSSEWKLPSCERTVKALGPVPEFLFRALEFGASQNRLFFEQLSENERPRPYLREMIVRDQAKRFLERNQFQVEDESVNVRHEPLAALVIRCGPVQARVLKAGSPEGLVPGCGDSERRRQFYNQAPEAYLGPNGKTITTKLNLLFLWDFDKAFNLGQVWLACPLRAGETSADVVLHFHEPLPHPAVSLAHPQSARQARKQAEDELENLLREEAQESDGEKQA